MIDQRSMVCRCTSNTGRESVCVRESEWEKQRQIVETDLAQHNNINDYLHTCSSRSPGRVLRRAVRWRQDPKRPRWTQEPCTRVPWRLHDTTQMHAAIARRAGSPTHHSTLQHPGKAVYRERTRRVPAMG